MEVESKPARSEKQRVVPNPRRYILRFLFVWIMSLVFIAFISLLSDVNWAKPHLEAKLEQELNRRFKLGRLTWCLGLNGIQIQTSSMQVDELTGEPFISSERADIGVSVLGLIARKLVITHLDFDNPVLKLVKTAPDTWNFDDLLVPGPEIRLIQINSGTIQLIDRTKEAKAEPSPGGMELTDLNLKFNWPRKKKKLPFFVSFNIPTESDPARLEVNGFTQGKLSDWAENQYSFKVRGEGIRPNLAERMQSILSSEPETAEKANALDLDEINGGFGNDVVAGDQGIIAMPLVLQSPARAVGASSRVMQAGSQAGNPRRLNFPKSITQNGMPVSARACS